MKLFKSNYEVPLPPVLEKKQYTWENGKKMQLTPELCALQLRYCYSHWRDIYNKGSSDPFYCDGTNLNLVRNHTIYYRKKIEELLGEAYYLYPDEYFWCDLPVVDENYLAKDKFFHYNGCVLKASEREYEVTF